LSDGRAAGAQGLDINDLSDGPMASGRWHFERYTGLPSSELTPDEIDRLRPRVDRHVDAGFDRPQFRKIHDALFVGYRGGPVVALDATRGAIYLVRDPRDVAVSWMHHAELAAARAVEQLADPAMAYAATPSGFHPQFRQRVGTWSDHVKSWLDQDLFDLLLVRYEDLQADAARELARIARFAGLEAPREAVARAVEAASFERLRGMEHEHGFFERPGRDQPFFRRGLSGAWRDELAPELARRIEEDHAEVMARLGYTPEASVTRHSAV
jgi:hypothetical protein